MENFKFLSKFSTETKFTAPVVNKKYKKTSKKQTERVSFDGYRKGRKAPKPEWFKLPEVCDKFKAAYAECYSGKWSLYDQMHKTTFRTIEAVIEQSLTSQDEVQLFLSMLSEMTRLEQHFTQRSAAFNISTPSEMLKLHVIVVFKPNYVRNINIFIQNGNNITVLAKKNIECTRTLRKIE